MQDGQNLFYNEEAYNGNSWDIKNTLEEMEKVKGFQEWIVVGIDNDMDRMDEYSPWNFRSDEETREREVNGAYGQEYAASIVETVIPFVNQHFKTTRDRMKTGIAGSSAGANISSFIAMEYPEIFGQVGIFSLATWLFKEEIDRYFIGQSKEYEQKFFIQVGTCEGYDDDFLSQEYVDASLDYYNKLIKMGYDPEEIFLNISCGDIHSEICWAKRFPQFMEFLNF